MPVPPHSLRMRIALAATSRNDAVLELLSMTLYRFLRKVRISTCHRYQAVRSGEGVLGVVGDSPPAHDVGLTPPLNCAARFIFV